MTVKVTSIVHGAVSIVNAVATGFGCAMGINLQVTVEIVSKKGSGIIFQKSGGHVMIKKIIYDILPSNFINNKLGTANEKLWGGSIKERNLADIERVLTGDQSSTVRDNGDKSASEGAGVTPGTPKQV